jgi:hypothetical protein
MNTIQNIPDMSKKYPTVWAYGMPRGWITDRRTNLLLSFSKGKKRHSFTYSVGNFDSKEECMKHVENEKIKKSRELGLTRNEIRFINKDTIEVKLTQNKTFKTDAKYLKIVNKYPLQAKAKKEKEITRYYVLGQDKKKTFQFTNLITNYEIVEYINGNTLDLRDINMKEFGFGIKVVENAEDIVNKNETDDESKYYFMEMEELPKNKWILGTVEGTVFFREHEKDKVLTMRTKNYDGNIQSKTFKISDYESVEKATLEAKKYMLNCGHYAGTVKNKIKISDDYLEVMLDEKTIMKTDLMFLPLFIPNTDNFQANMIVSKTSSAGSKKIYAVIYNKITSTLIKYHQFIMGGPMIDHINGDSLDNRLINLRFTNYSQNNSNRIANDASSTNGVKHGVNKIGKYYLATILHDEHTYYKNFYVDTYGDNAKIFAIKFRKYILELNPITEDLSDLPLDKSDIKTIKKIH